MTITFAPEVPTAVTAARRLPRTNALSAFATLARRRFALSAHTPREVLVPLITPILFAVVIAPALAESMPSNGIDYVSFAAVGTIGLLVPLSCILGGIGMIVDRESGAQRDLLAAPVPRRAMVFGNLAVALTVSSFQVVALMVASVLRGASFHITASGIAWSAAAVVGLAVAMHGLAEILAARLEKQEEYVGAAPAVALVPWFFAGSLFPITSMPAGLTAFAKVLPLTHALAVMRYGLVDPSGRGLHDIWGMDNTTVMAMLSLTVTVAFALVVLVVSTRVFTRAAIH